MMNRPKEIFISTDSFYPRNPYKELLNGIYGAKRMEAEMNLMNLNNTKVVVGSKVFRPHEIEYNSLDCELTIKTHMLPGDFIRPYGVSSDEIREYCMADVAASKELYDLMKERNRFRIEKVIFNDPATIVFWADGTKTVVKAEGEAFDPEKGLAMAMCKKMLGNNGKYYKEFKKWLPKEADK